MRTNLDTDPRVIQMAHSLDTTELHIVGCLWKLWGWADSHTLDGNAICVTDVTLDRFTCNGFADALRKVGWLSGRNGALTFPRFAEHNGQTAKKRLETKARVSAYRARKQAKSDESGENPATGPDVTKKRYTCNKKTLPEKRREEKRRVHTHTHHSSEVTSADEAERASVCGDGAFDEPMGQILKAAGFRRSVWSASEYSEFAAHPQILTHAESVSVIVGAVAAWKKSQEASPGRKVAVSAREIGRRLPEIWDWADANGRPRRQSDSQYLNYDDMLKA